MSQDAIDEGRIHATFVAMPREGSWHGALLLGEAGSGKSDLALRLIDKGWRLVADDNVILSADEGVVHGRAPQQTAGKLAISGLGIVEEPFCEEAPVRLVVQIEEAPPSYPMDKSILTVCQKPLPTIRLNAFWPSAPIIVQRALLDSQKGDI